MITMPENDIIIITTLARNAFLLGYGRGRIKTGPNPGEDKAAWSNEMNLALAGFPMMNTAVEVTTGEFTKQDIPARLSARAIALLGDLLQSTPGYIDRLTMTRQEQLELMEMEA